jgi:hypothetical protein
MGVMRFKLAEQRDDVTRDRDAHKKAMQGRSAGCQYGRADRVWCGAVCGDRQRAAA